jgi:hypothetical protein
VYVVCYINIDFVSIKIVSETLSVIPSSHLYLLTADGIL